MNATTPLNFLIGFLCFFIYLALVLAVSFKSDSISIYDQKRFNKNRIVQQTVWCAPFLIGFIYLLLTKRAGLNEFLMLVFLPVIFLFGGEYFLFQPKLNSLKRDANKVFTSLKYANADSRCCFDSKTDELLLNRDEPVYIRGWLVDLRLDRVCKNTFGEYFWIVGSTNRNSITNIKHLDPHAVRNLLRVDRDVYLQEFNEEPYFKSK